MYTTESDSGQIWEDPDANRRASALLRRVVAGLLLAALLGPVVVATVGYRAAVTAERDEDLALSAVIGLAPTASIGSLLDASGHQGLLLEPDGSLAAVWTSDAASESVDLRSWWRDVADDARASPTRSFTDEDPSGTTWWFSRVVARDDRTLIVGRPAPDALGFLTGTVVALTLGTIAMVGVLLTIAIGLHRRVVRPLEMLVDATEDLRVRGEVRAETRAGLAAIPPRPLELQRLGETLLEIEKDSTRGFRQAEGLFQAASALGGSLEPGVVLETALEHLQRLLSIDRAAILHHDSRRQAFEVAASRGHPDGWIAEMQTVRAIETQPSLRSIREGVPVQVTDTESEVAGTELRERGRRHGYRSILAVPLSSGLEVATALVLHSVEPRAWSWDEIELSKSFASIAGAALRNAELFAQTDARLRSQTSRLEAIVESVEQGILVEGADGRVLFANATMQQFLPAAFPLSRGARADELLANAVGGTAGQNLALDLGALPSSSDAWLDVDVPVGEEVRSVRIRRFVVRDVRGEEIGSGQTWSDVSRDRELERMKSGLLAAVSHEFRTPLALIKGYATTLLAEDVSWNPADQNEFLQLVSAEADRLTELVQRILDMRRIDAGMVSLQKMPVALSVIVDTVVDGLPHEAHRIRIGQLPHGAVDIDAARIVTSLRNLIENACKYSPRDAVVEVSVVTTQDAVEFCVRDHGRGIDPALRDHVFDTFVRGETGLAAEHGGVGLGLAISKGFVEAHGGRMWITDPTEGTGAEFRFSLPRLIRLREHA